MQKKDFQTILVIKFWEFLMLDQIFLSPQAKRMVIISTKHFIYELSYKLPDDLRLRILGNKEILTRSQIFTQLQPSTQSSSQNGNFVNTSKKLFEKFKFNVFRTVLHQPNTKPYLIYFGQDCLKNFLLHFSSSLRVLNFENSNFVAEIYFIFLKTCTRSNFKCFQ